MTRAIVLAACMTAPIAYGELINPGFEPDGGAAATNVLPGGSSAIPGWTTVGAGAEWFDVSQFGIESPNGGYAVDLCNFTFVGGGIEQTFSTTVGEAYTVEFYYSTQRAFGRLGTADITVSADGQSEVMSIENLSTSLVWELRSFSFIADDSEATLRFESFQNANLHFANIDGVSIVPAPGAGALAACGLGGLMRRRRS